MKNEKGIASCKRLSVRSLLTLGALMVTMLVIGGCGGLTTPVPEVTEPSGQAGGEPAVGAADLEGRTWVLISYGSPDNPQSVLEGGEVTMTLDLAAGQVSGSAGCNSYSGGVAVDGGGLSVISPIAMTMMACADEGLMDQESQFLAILAVAQSYTIENGSLRVVSADGQVLTFTVQGEASSPGGSPSGPVISITEPQDGAGLDLGQAVHIEGTGQGLFEGNLMVEILDADGNALAGQPTIMQGEDVGVGAPGEWAVDLVVEAEPGASGQIFAHAASPMDGHIVASASVAVTFGGP